MSKEINRLPPALREKKRYMKFKIHSKKKFDLGELVDATWKNTIDYLGTKEVSKADFWVIGNQFNKDEQTGIIKVQREQLDNFRAALTLLDEIDGNKAFLQVTQVSGSIKKLKNSS